MTVCNIVQSSVTHYAISCAVVLIAHIMHLSFQCIQQNIQFYRNIDNVNVPYVISDT